MLQAAPRRVCKNIAGDIPGEIRLEERHPIDDENKWMAISSIRGGVLVGGRQFDPMRS